MPIASCGAARAEFRHGGACEQHLVNAVGSNTAGTHAAALMVSCQSFTGTLKKEDKKQNKKKPSSKCDPRMRPVMPNVQ